MKRVFLYHIPFIGVVLILVLMWLTDTGVLGGLRNERTFARFVVVVMPLAGLLVLLQIIFWVILLERRLKRK